MVGEALSPVDANLTGAGAPPSNLTASKSSASHALLVGCVVRDSNSGHQLL